ncbi:hypothetical protein GCM10007939_03300 [Amylibacter marinus]|uniref:Uncharacterized protein n=1 Tax=Amylibacter marinus TaxID=1475483 RepID=A0ABQ5VRK6_9RHOB|nr:hypothetical protein [Amylibacter marinus]GLQ34047.1 hypothetical protein GCM10007939_03300 [Amylibacter marinus]
MTFEIPQGVDGLMYIRERALLNLKTYEQQLRRAIDDLKNPDPEQKIPDQSVLLRNFEKANFQLIDVMLKIEKTIPVKPEARDGALDFEAACAEILEKLDRLETASTQEISKQS